MTSMGSSMQTTQQQSYLSKTVNMVSSLTTQVVDGASTIGEAVGLKTNKKGILGNPSLAGSMQNQYPANYNPPTSISSETYSA